MKGNKPTIKQKKKNHEKIPADFNFGKFWYHLLDRCDAGLMKGVGHYHKHAEYTSLSWCPIETTKGSPQPKICLWDVKDHI